MRNPIIDEIAKNIIVNAAEHVLFYCAADNLGRLSSVIQQSRPEKIFEQDTTLILTLSYDQELKDLKSDQLIMATIAELIRQRIIANERQIVRICFEKRKATPETMQIILTDANA